ncbi:G-protein coupled receptor 143-like isoform X2 [Cylas formicarius]|uniref:G-protein coupled receptor 143-like isoform X2 n=1 Tax=Cylas formicarius TaxID=197179 RepID=UPI002958D2F4|nr:G-protein coupled receptor 143-like isoform X2 [Cylas formicarius]
MSDPTIQTFCCRRGNGSDVANVIVDAFDANVYNVACVCSSLLGALGAIYQILPRTQSRGRSKLVSHTESRGRKIVTWLAMADLAAAIGVLARSLSWMSHGSILSTTVDSPTIMFCVGTSTFIQYFYASTWFWTVFYALDMRQVLKRNEPDFSRYHLTAWTVPAILTAVGLFPLYYPNASCHEGVSHGETALRVLPNYLVTYVPILAVMVASPWAYCSSLRDLRRIVSGTSGQYTEKERGIVHAIKFKCAAINAVYYGCWLPNLVNGVMVWALPGACPARYLVLVWYVMAFTNPLQAFLNCLVYRRWAVGSERITLPWRQTWRTDSPSADARSSQKTSEDETYPLLLSTLSA